MNLIPLTIAAVGRLSARPRLWPPLHHTPRQLSGRPPMRPSLAETSMTKISSRNHSRSSCRVSKMTKRRSRCHRQLPILVLVHSLAVVSALCLCHSQSSFKCNAFTTLPSFSIVKIQRYHTVGGSRRHSSSSDIVDIDEDVNDANDKHHHQHLQAMRNRRDFVVRSIATASTVVVGSTTMSMTPPFVDWAVADDETPSSTSSTATIIDPAIQMPTITQKIYLDIKFEKYVEPKRLVIGLFGKNLPRTVENFVKLCTNENGASYVGSTFYRGTILHTRKHASHCTNYDHLTHSPSSSTSLDYYVPPWLQSTIFLRSTIRKLYPRRCHWQSQQ